MTPPNLHMVQPPGRRPWMTYMTATTHADHCKLFVSAAVLQAIRMGWDGSQFGRHLFFFATGVRRGQGAFPSSDMSLVASRSSKKLQRLCLRGCNQGSADCAVVSRTLA